MRNADRFKLHGDYQTPRYRLGDRVECEGRGTVRIVGTSAGRIPWPIGRKGKSTAFVIYDGLYRALRTESPTAIAHWWGVTVRVVSHWRTALGMAGKRTAGSKLLREKCGRDLSVLKSGIPRSPETIAKMRAAATGKTHSAASKRKMTKERKARGVRPPWLNPAWTPQEDKLLRSLSAAEVAEHTGRTLIAIYSRRRDLRRGNLSLPDARRVPTDPQKAPKA